MATLTRRTPPPPLRPTLSALTPANLAPGREVPLGKFIVEQIRLGVDPYNAAGIVGVLPDEFRAWMRVGTITLNKLAQGANWHTDFTPDEQDAAVFADEAIKARSEHIVRLSTLTEQAARGGAKRTRTTVKQQPDATGQLVDVERTTVEEVLPPDASVAMWKLERLEARIYGNRQTIDLTVSDLTDTDDVGDALERKMLEVAASLDQHLGPIDTTATEESSL